MGRAASLMVPLIQKEGVGCHGPLHDKLSPGADFGHTFNVSISNIVHISTVCCAGIIILVAYEVHPCVVAQCVGISILNMGLGFAYRDGPVLQFLAKGLPEVSIAAIWR